MSILRIKDFNSLMIALLVVAFSTIPDIDLRLEIKHRSYTHNLLAAIIFGLILGVIFHYFWISFWAGFMGGFGGTILHIIGDLLTYQPFAPLAPFYRKKFALKLFRSNDRIVNRSFLGIGGMTLIIYMLYVLAGTI